MTVTEANRFEMHLKLRDMMGDDVADTLMEHLPPAGWADVARKSDVDNLKSVTDLRFTSIDSRLSGIVAGMWTMGAVFTAAFVGLFTLIATKL